MSVRFVAVMDRSLSNQFVRRRRSRRLTLIKNREKYKRPDRVRPFARALRDEASRDETSFCIKRLRVHHENRSGIFRYRKSSPSDSCAARSLFFSFSLFSPLSFSFLSFFFFLFFSLYGHEETLRGSARGACGRLNSEKLLNYGTL